MAWTYEQRMERAANLLVDKSLLAADQIERLNRPLFHGKYRFGIGISCTAESWHMYDELKEQVTRALAPMDVFIHSNRKTFDFYIFSNNPKVVRWVARNHKHFFVSYLRIIPKSAWSRPMPAPKPKGKFFGQFTYRIRLKQWDMDVIRADEGTPEWPATIPPWQGPGPCPTRVIPGITHHAIRAVKGPKRVLRQGPRLERSFIYVEQMSDLLMLKLILGKDIAEIEDRS